MDPLLAELLQHNTVRSPVTLHIQGRDVRAFMPVGNVDQRRIHHLLKLILALIRHGGNSFIAAITPTCECNITLEKAQYSSQRSIVFGTNPPCADTVRTLLS
jgi:hypothetical protein